MGWPLSYIGMYMFLLSIVLIVSIYTNLISVHINNSFEYSCHTDNFLKDLIIKKNLKGSYTIMLVLRSCNHTSTHIQWYSMLSIEPCACQIAIMYDLVRTACRFFNLLKVDMFLNPTDIKPAQDAADKSLLYTPERGVLSEFHVLPCINPSFLLLNVGYPNHCYWNLIRYQQPPPSPTPPTPSPSE